MKKIIAIVLLLAGLVEAQNYQPISDGKDYGKGISQKDTVSVSSLLTFPEKYIGKTVTVKGNITDVCEKRGCWIKLSGDKPYQTITVKVNDGEIVFPLEAKGKPAVAEGKFEVIELSLEQTKKYLAHKAEEEGKKFDSESVTEPLKIYRIKGSGARIAE